MIEPQPEQYRLMGLKLDRRRCARALIVGPGARAGVWYLVSSARAAEALVDSLNLALLYARELKAARGARPRAKRKIN